MQDLCPLCLKNGVKKNIKLLQINLQEAVWMCEDEKCTWPFGSRHLVFSPRPVGKIWSCYWDNHKSTGKLKDTAVTSIQLSLSSPSTIPVKNMSIEYVTTSNLIRNYTGNSNNINPIEMKSSTDDSEASLHVKSEALLFNNDKEKCEIEATNNSDTINDNLQLINDKTKNTNINNEFINILDNQFERERNGYIQSNQNVSTIKEIPRITNVEETNIDLSKSKKNHVTAIKKTDKRLLCTNKIGNIENKTCQPTYLSESEKLINSESFIKEEYSNEIMEIKSNLNVTKVEIDGLPPITLSYEIPVCTTNSKTVTANIKQNINKGIISDNSKSNAPLIRKITSGKQYEKFSFSNIKKKLETNNSVDANNKNGKTSNNNVKIKNSDKISDGNENVTGSNTNCEQLASLTHDIYNCTSKRKNSVTTNNFSTEESIPQDTSIANTSINIDTVLDDLLSNDYSVSENINDDWLNSLLT